MNNKKVSSYSKHWYNIWWVWLLGGILICVGIPLIINYIFKESAALDLFKAEWSAGDALGFYGTMMGSIATIVAVVVTIIFTNNQNRISELFQRNMIVANNRKVFLEEKYENIFSKLQEIKDVILLDALEDEGILGILMKKAFMTYPQKLMECCLNLEYILRSRKKSIDSIDEIEQKFVKSTFDTLELIRNEFIGLAERMENPETDKNESKEQDNNTRQIQIQIERALGADIHRKKTEINNKNEQKSNQHITKEFKDLLHKKKDEYKSDYSILFDQYWEHLKHEQQTLIDELYNF